MSFAFAPGCSNMYIPEMKTKIANWFKNWFKLLSNELDKKLIDINQKIIDETTNKEYIYSKIRLEESKRRIEIVNGLVNKLTEEIEDALTTVDPTKPQMELTYNSISTYMREKPNWIESITQLYEINSLLTKEQIKVTEPIAVKAVFDLAWNNKIIFVGEYEKVNKNSVKDYINNQFKLCREPIEIGRRPRRTAMTLASKFYEKDIPIGTKVFYNGLDENGRPQKIMGTVKAVDNSGVSFTARNIVPLNIKVDTIYGDIDKAETELYIQTQTTRKNRDGRSKSRSQSRSRSRSRSRIGPRDRRHSRSRSPSPPLSRIV